MNEENKKLEAVRRSCNAAKIVSKIILIVFIIGTVFTLVSGCTFILNSDAMDKTIESRLRGSGIEKDITIGNKHIGTLTEDGLVTGKDIEITSSIPSLNSYYQEKSKSVSYVLGFYILLLFVVLLILTVSVAVIGSIFDIILKEGNPFTEKVKNRMIIVLVVLTALVFFIAGIGGAALCGITSWAVITIMDYGCILKTQSDETL